MVKWDYSGVDEVCYSDNEQESYKKSAEFLGDSVEDWGCGTGWAKKYFKNYRGIDGSPAKYVDEVVDLTDYTSDVDNILIRQVLELNEDWENILKNAINSFKKKLCLVIFTPMADTTHIGEKGMIHDSKGNKTGEVSMIYFNKQDILDYFKGYKVKEETIKTGQGYGQEWILYVEKI